MPESYFQWSERQAEQDRRDERMAREDRFRDPGPTRYAIKDKTGLSTYYRGENQTWGKRYDAKQFNSATEASLYALEHNITGVEIVAV